MGQALYTQSELRYQKKKILTLRFQLTHLLLELEGFLGLSNASCEQLQL